MALTSIKEFVLLVDEGLAGVGAKLLYPEKAPAGYWIPKQKKLVECKVEPEDARKLGVWLSGQPWFLKEPSVVRLFYGLKLLDYLVSARAAVPDERPIRRL